MRGLKAWFVEDPFRGIAAGLFFAWALAVVFVPNVSFRMFSALTAVLFLAVVIWRTKRLKKAR